MRLRSKQSVAGLELGALDGRKAKPRSRSGDLIRSLTHAIHTPVVGIHGCQAPIDIGKFPLRREPYFIGKHISRNALLIRWDVGRTMVPPSQVCREG